MTTGEKFEKVADAVYDKGRNDERSDFWGNHQSNKINGNYEYAYSGNCWNAKNFNPEHSMNVKSADGMFFRNQFRNAKPENLIDLRKYDISFSECTSFSNMCSFAYGIEAIGVVDTRRNFSLQNIFNYAINLHTVEKVILMEASQSYTNPFVRCDSLENIRFEGKILATISFSSSPLTVESMKSVISCLANYKGTTSEGTHLIKFRSDCWEALEASGTPYEDGLTDDETMSWQAYVTGVLGWNV